MNSHTIFYYPYASFQDEQALLLKAAALFFDKLYILDPVKASLNTIGEGSMERDLELLEGEQILKRVSPDEVLHKYEAAIADAIRADLQDRQFLEMCRIHGGGSWMLALAKVPKEIRDDPKFQPLDQSMKHMMGDFARSLSAEVANYDETAAGFSEFAEHGAAYDESGESGGKPIEYRYAHYPLALGEAIMLNHALFGSLAYTGATPLTDNSFHNQVLNRKIERARQIPEVRAILEERANGRHLKRELLAANALTDVDLGVIPADMSLEKVLNYRQKHAAELDQARDRLGWMAREIRQSPWTTEFGDELEHSIIPKLNKELVPAKKSWTSWIKASGFVLGGTAAVLSFITTPLLPVAVTIGALGIATGVALPRTDYYVCKARHKGHTCIAGYMRRDRLEALLDSLFSDKLTSPAFLKRVEREMKKSHTRCGLSRGFTSALAKTARLRFTPRPNASTCRLGLGGAA
ncbi:MAG: zinc ribbon domain-containing protein [Acidobacteria bacterium]|nr:zinc ribbon domain-containing protein [Acidobacteriota bacterium]